MDSTPDTPQTVPCPHCEYPAPADPVSVLNEGSSSLDQLFEGTLNRFLCPDCERDFLLETPLLYRDDNARYMAYYLPRSMVDSLDKALEQMQELYASIFEEIDDIDRPTCRLALSRSQFIEKIALHQFEYDDRVIEYIKYQLFQHNQGLDPVRHQLLFDFGNSDDDAIVFIAYDRDPGKADYSLGFTREDYDQLAQHVFSTVEMEDELNQLFRRFYVSVDDILAE